MPRDAEADESCVFLRDAEGKNEKKDEPQECQARTAGPSQPSSPLYGRIPARPTSGQPSSSIIFFRGGAEGSAPRAEGSPPCGLRRSRPGPSFGKKPCLRAGLASTPEEVDQQQGFLYWNIRGLIPSSNKTKVSSLNERPGDAEESFLHTLDRHISVRQF